MGRYDTVRAALLDWQDFQSAAGVGISNFRYETPWRPPSLLLEADPPHHSAPRATLAKVLSPRSIKRMAPLWQADASALLDQLLSGPLEFDGVPALVEAFPLRVFPDSVGLLADGREVLLHYGDHLFNAFGPENFLVAKGAPNSAAMSGPSMNCALGSILLPAASARTSGPPPTEGTSAPLRHHSSSDHCCPPESKQQFMPSAQSSTQLRRIQTSGKH